MHDHRTSGASLFTVAASAGIAIVFGFAAGVLGANPHVADAIVGSFGPTLRRVTNIEVPAETAPGAPMGEKVVTEEERVISVVERRSPAVVSIVISKDVPVYEQYYVNPFEGDPNFEQFFGNQMPGFSVPQLRQKGTERQRVGAGTGFLVSADGFVVTNRHVVEQEGAEYTVIMSDGGKFTAKILARDPANDIAVLKIDPPEGTEFPFIPFGDSDALRVGQKAVVIGYALGRFGNSVSLGIVSGLQRSIEAGDAMRGTLESLFDVIQTDAAINPGNSGGPLLDLNGDAIGMSVAIVQGAQSIGFALPGNDVRRVVGAVRKDGKISRAFLGVRYVMLTKEMQDKNQLPVDYGALVVRGDQQTDLAVTPGSPADIAGIVENDIILEVNGKKLTAEYPLFLAVSKFNPGDVIHLKVLSKGKEKAVSVTLVERK